MRKYVIGPPGLPGPPGAPGQGSARFSTEEVAERVLSMMSGECQGTPLIPLISMFCLASD